MIYPRLRDFFALSNQYDSISQETHIIASAAPYAIDLNQVPQVKAGITAVIENVWVSASVAASLITVEIETSPATWTAATITESLSPTANQVGLQISDSTTFPFSPRLIFHSSHAGQQVRITYTGWGSVPLARHMTTLWQQMEQAYDALPPMLLSMENWNGGRIDGKGAADKTCYLTGSYGLLLGSGGDTGQYPGGILNFGSGGNAEVATFSNVNYFKRILVSIDIVGTTWNVITSESSESSTSLGLTSPEIDYRYIPVGYVDVQNDGEVISAGSILAISSSAVAPISSSTRKPIQTHVFRLTGSLIADSEIEVPFFPGKDGTVLSISCLIQNSGTSGSTTLDILRCDSGTPAGVSIFSEASKITVISNASAVGTVTVDAADLTNVDFTDSQWFKFEVTSTVATGAADICGVMYYVN